LIDDQTQLTLDVLQQNLLSKVPPSPYARVAGENGLKLTRAAFAASLKLSEQLEAFRILSEEVEMASMDVGDEFTGLQRLRKIVEKLQEYESKELQPMMTRWESASEIRRWLNDKKGYMSQDTVKEEKEAFIKEVNLSDPSKKGKFEGPLTVE